MAKSADHSLVLPPCWAETLTYIERLHKVFHKAKDRGDVTFSAFSALNLSFALATVLNPKFPQDGDQQEYFAVPVPLWALQHLVNAVNDYLAAEPGKTFGEVLGIEGGRQGKQRAKDKLATRIARRELALWVEILRRHHQAEGNKEEAKLVNILAEVAERAGYGMDSVQKAYKKYRRTLGGKRKPKKG